MQEKKKSGLRAGGLVLIAGCALVAWGATERGSSTAHGGRDGGWAARLGGRVWLLEVGSGDNSTSTSSPLDGNVRRNSFSKMMEDYDMASDDDLKKAGLTRATGSKDCTVDSGKGCMEENDRSFNALKFMIWRRQHDPTAKNGAEEEWANNAITIAEKIAQEASAKATQERLELNTALKDLASKRRVDEVTMRKMFTSQTVRQQREVAKLRVELKKEKLELDHREEPKLQLFQIKTDQELKRVDSEDEARRAQQKIQSAAQEKAALAKLREGDSAKVQQLEEEITTQKVADVVERKEVSVAKAAQLEADKALKREKTKLSKAEKVFENQLMLASTASPPLAPSPSSASPAAPTTSSPTTKASALAVSSPPDAAAADATAPEAATAVTAVPKEGGGGDVKKAAAEAPAAVPAVNKAVLAAVAASASSSSATAAKPVAAEAAPAAAKAVSPAVAKAASEATLKAKASPEATAVLSPTTGSSSASSKHSPESMIGDLEQVF